MQLTSGLIQSGLRNMLLAALPEEEYKHIFPHLELVILRNDDSVYLQEDPINYLYFPLDCIISSLLIMNDGAMAETGMMGRESIVGVSAVFGEQKVRAWMRVLVPGSALRLRSEVVREIAGKRAAIERVLLRAYRSMVTHISQRLVCNGRHTILHRVATWLLLVHDRVGSDTLPLTQELISNRLGARRASITQAAGYLQNVKAISYKRGKIHVDDREIIESEACECYEALKKEFDSLENLRGGRKDSGPNRIPTFSWNEASRRPLNERCRLVHTRLFEKAGSNI